MAAQALLDEVLREVVGDGDQGGVVEESDEAGHAEEGATRDGDTVGVQGLEGGAPHLTEVDLVGHGRTPQIPAARWPIDSLSALILPR
ncbi:hypothetical protein B277_07071 [Janibacter hoylei PVAS-1]|uniref:Uncharacterized protein n=1 Tax=Janibacter hoylei PVAS-1 TaxID=1210046 RepID=K1DY70_9MICO|nr:hypothetical protein B277_07071 [Janibacter hoylei PVAS-1]